MIVTQLTRLLSVPPGDLVYHLVVLFAIEAILLMAIGEGRRSGWPGGALRLTLAASGALVLRGAQVMVALLSSRRRCQLGLGHAATGTLCGCRKSGLAGVGVLAARGRLSRRRGWCLSSSI